MSSREAEVAPGAAGAWDPAFQVFTDEDCRVIREASPLELGDWDAVSRSVMAVEREMLRALCVRTLVLELNCARLLGQLAGDAPEERFADFLARFRDPVGWATLFDEYSVLGRLVGVARRNFRLQVIELLERLSADRAALADHLAIPTGRLVRLTASLSDPHRGGRGVWKLAFHRDRDDAFLMYKPKSLAVDARFQGLLERANLAIARGDLDLPRFRTLQILDRGDYGWVEHVAPAPCEDAGSADRFYRRQGAMLALLHVTCGTDVHYENLIAHGEHPLVVDLETLFHPFLVPEEAAPTARGAAERLLESSVLRVGLLPWRAFRRDGVAGVNIGAVGDGETQSLPFLVPRWEDAGRDDMKLVEKKVVLPAAENLPRIADRVAPFHEHIDAIVGGFESMARHVVRDRDWLQRAFDEFAGDPVRYVLRPTRTYAKVLQATSHPDHLREPSSSARVRAVLDELADAVAAAPGVRAAEDADLAECDVPYFSGRPGRPDVWSSRGRRIGSLFPRTGLALARGRLAAFDDAEVDRQLWYTRAALAAAAIQHTVPEIGAARDRQPVGASADRLLFLAAELGAELADRAVSGRDGATWIGLVGSGTETFTIAPLGADLYDGVGGIALFLAVLGRAIAEDRFLVLAEKAARYVRAELEGGRTRNHVGGFIGVPSQLYAVAHVAAIVGDDCGLREMMRVALDRLSAGLAESGESDVIYGAAGAILALLGLGRPAESLLPHLLACLEVLERTARPFADGLAWPSPGGRPLLGFSHGNAGIACALVRLATALEGVDHPARERCRKVAVSARRYERARFDPDRRNWPDFRGSEPDGRDQVSWCHGAPGVVLSRLPLADEDCLSEIEIGMETTLGPGRQSRHTLCHGEVGNLVIAAHVAERLGRDDWRRCVAGRLPGLLDAIATRPKVDSAFAGAAPGLMTGLAGVGYGLIALAHPTAVPLVLALEPPSW